MSVADFEKLDTYYRSLPKYGSVTGKCAMSLPANLDGKRVLDVFCRAGKGAYELSDHVGAGGFVMGVDVDEGRMERARINAPMNHAAGEDWERNLSFRQGFPETVSEIIPDEQMFDVVYINSAINFVFSLEWALIEFHSVLRSDGYLWIAQGIFADRDDGAVASEVSHLDTRVGEDGLAYSAEPGFGNVFARALSPDDFRSHCLAAGFSDVRFGKVSPIVPDGHDAMESLQGRRFITCDVCALG